MINLKEYNLSAKGYTILANAVKTDPDPISMLEDSVLQGPVSPALVSACNYNKEIINFLVKNNLYNITINNIDPSQRRYICRYSYGVIVTKDIKKTPGKGHPTDLKTALLHFIGTGLSVDDIKKAAYQSFLEQYPEFALSN